MYDVKDDHPIYSRLDKILIVICAFIYCLIILGCFFFHAIYTFFSK
jgi:hypothetical protein